MSKENRIANSKAGTEATGNRQPSTRSKKHYGIGHISRLKQRFLEDKIAKPELIELLLSYVIKGRDVKAEAKEIYARSGGSFREAFGAVEKQEIPGIGPEARTFFRVLKKFIDAYFEDKFSSRKYSVRDQKDVIEFFRTSCADNDREAVYALFLDAKNRVIANKKLSEGTLTQSVVYPREIIKEAITKAALSVVLVHNHPSGSPVPSDMDRKITKKLLFAAKEMDINLLDHMIVAGNGHFSFYENGLIERYNGEYRNFMESSL
jgi:DNA repair protein RadC